MKKYLLILVSFLVTQIIFGQIVFCPPGAKWHFLNKSGADSYPFEKNEAVTYSHDSIIGGVSAKVLTHSVFYMANSEACKITLIKQGGDTVFIRNKFTQNTWQVLYNFNATIGQSWFNTLSVNTTSGTVVYNFKTTVDSVSNFTANSTNFKRMYVSLYIYMNGFEILVNNLIITERFGCNRFLFYWSVPNSFFEINYFTQILCYEDNSWPLQQFSSKPCNYSNILGLKQTLYEQEIIKVFPNPVMDVLTIEWESSSSFDTIELKIFNCLGVQLKQRTIKNGETVLVNDLSKGLYFIEAFSNKKRVYSTKILKQ